MSLTGTPRWGIIAVRTADAPDQMPDDAVLVSELQLQCNWMKVCSSDVCQPINAGVKARLQLPGLTSKYWTGQGSFLFPETTTRPYSIYPGGDPNVPSYLQQDIAAQFSPVGLGLDCVFLVVFGNGWFRGYTYGPQFSLFFGCPGLCAGGWAGLGAPGQVNMHEYGHLLGGWHCSDLKGLAAGEVTVPDFTASLTMQDSPSEIMGTGAYDKLTGWPLSLLKQTSFYPPQLMRRAGFPDNVTRIPIAGGEYVARPVAGGFNLYVLLFTMRTMTEEVKLVSPSPLWTDFYDRFRNLRIQWLNGSIVVTENYTPPVISTYALTVTNGTGSGNFAPGQAVTITANPSPRKMKFYQWTGNVTFANRLSATTSLTMPAVDSTVQANYVRR